MFEMVVRSTVENKAWTRNPSNTQKILIIFSLFDQVIPNTILNTKVILASQRRHSAIQQKHFTKIVPDDFLRWHLLKRRDKMQLTIWGSKKITPRGTGFRLWSGCPRTDTVSVCLCCKTFWQPIFKILDDLVNDATYYNNRIVVYTGRERLIRTRLIRSST